PTGERERSRLVPFARSCGLLEWIALEVCHAGRELALDSRNVEAEGSFGRDREIHLPVLVAHCRRARAGILEEGVSRRLVGLTRTLVNLVDVVSRRLSDPLIGAFFELRLQIVPLGSASNFYECRQPVE